MKSDLNIDCPLSFSILLDEELDNFPMLNKGAREQLHNLLMIVFKEGYKCGQRPENNIRYKEMVG